MPLSYLPATTSIKTLTRKDKSTFRKAHPVIIDGRNIIDPDTFVNQGFIYKGIGRGDKNMHKISHKIADR